MRAKRIRKFNPEWRKRVESTCHACGLIFQAVEAEIKRGKGLVCSLSCAASLSAFSRIDQTGDRNPNWKGGQKKTDGYRDYRKRFPEKYAAHLQLTNAIRSGTLSRKPCAICGNTKVDGHHDDYTKPLDVVWLCRKHHKEIHTSR